MRRAHDLESELTTEVPAVSLSTGRHASANAVCWKRVAIMVLSLSVFSLLLCLSLAWTSLQLPLGLNLFDDEERKYDMVVPSADLSLLSRVYADAITLPMIQLFGPEKVAQAITTRESWFRDIQKDMDAWIKEHRRPYSWWHYDLFGPVFNLCPPEAIDHFGFGDEERLVCSMDRLIELSGGNCQILSIGSNDEWAFEHYVFYMTNCTVHTFDCTGNYTPPQNLSSRVFFYRKCIGDPTTGPDFLLYKGVHHLAGIKGAPTYFKIDVEGFEWNIFPDMMKAEDLPEQIGFELHHSELMPNLGWHTGGKTLKDIVFFGEMLYQAGYLPIHRRDNNYGNRGEATEFLLAKVAHQNKRS